jgi:hypothetical protein
MPERGVVGVCSAGPSLRLPAGHDGGRWATDEGRLEAISSGMIHCASAMAVVRPVSRLAMTK